MDNDSNSDFESSSKELPDHEESAWNNDCISLNSSHKGILPKDAWFGRHYFKTLLAHHIFFLSRVEEAQPSLDVILSAQLLKYPYEDCLKYVLQKIRCDSSTDTKDLRYWKDVKNDFPNELFSLIGSIFRQESNEAKKMARFALQKFMIFDRSTFYTQPPDRILKDQEADETCNLLQPDDKPWFVHDTTASLMAGTIKVPKESEISELSVYTQKLKEYGEKIGTTPYYDTDSISLTPPRYKVILRFQNVTAEGVGSKKRLAKHLASKHACELLDLRLFE